MLEGSLGGLRVERQEEALLPHTGRRVTLPLKDIATHWRRAASKDLQDPGLSPEEEMALKTAMTLVNRTQIVPFLQQDSASHGAIVID